MKKLLSICLIAVMSLTVATVAAKTNNTSSKTVYVTTKFAADIDCPTCEETIMKKIPYEKGVTEVKVDTKSKIVTVTYDEDKNSDDKLIKSFSKIKIEAKVATDNSKNTQSTQNSQNSQNSQSKK